MKELSVFAQWSDNSRLSRWTATWSTRLSGRRWDYEVISPLHPPASSRISVIHKRAVAKLCFPTTPDDDDEMISKMAFATPSGFSCTACNGDAYVELLTYSQKQWTTH